MLVPNYNSKPPAVCSTGIIITPALLTSPSICDSSSRTP